MKKVLFLPMLFVLILSGCIHERIFSPEQEKLSSEAAARAPLVNECFNRCVKFF